MKILAYIYDNLYKYYKINSDFHNYIITLSKKYNNNGFATNSHTIHEFYLKSHEKTCIKYKIIISNNV